MNAHNILTNLYFIIQFIDLTNQYLFQSIYSMSVAPAQMTKSIFEKSLNEQRKIILEIENAFNNQIEFKTFMRMVESGMMIEQLVDTLQDYFGKKQAKQVAKLFFQQMIQPKFTKLKLLISYLKRQNYLNSQEIQEIRVKITKWIDEGKAKRIQKLLIERLGNSKGIEKFKFIQSQIKQKQTKLINGSSFLYEQNGLKVYKYPQQKKGETMKTKNIIIFGQTGCGKSTFINAVCNYILQIQHDDEIRYKVIIDHIKDKNFSSQTSQVTDHYIKNDKENITYRFIDTPGFGDTNGFIVDEQTIEQIKLKLKQLDSLHLIIFALKSSQTRLTEYQKYILLSVINLFTRQCIPNILFLLTFSDGGSSKALQILEDKNEGLGESYSLIPQPKYVNINNSCIFHEITDQIYWISSFDSIKKVLSKINGCEQVSMKLSQKYFRRQQDFSTTLQQFHSKAELIDLCQQKVVKDLDQISKIQKDLSKFSSKFYQIKTQFKQFPTTKLVLRCLNCKTLNCHLNCVEIKGGNHPFDPSSCTIFSSSDTCSTCKCHKTVHTKTYKKVQPVQTKSYKNDDKITKTILQLQNNLGESIRKYEYNSYRYCFGFQQMFKKKKQMDFINSKIEKSGLLKQQKFIEAKYNYVKLALNNHKPQEKQFKKLNQQLIFLQQSLNFSKFPQKRISEFKSLLQKSQQKYSQTKKSLRLFKDIMIVLIQLHQIMKRQYIYQLNNQSEYQENANNIKDQQKDQCFTKQCCCDFLKCILCCCFCN